MKICSRSSCLAIIAGALIAPDIVHAQVGYIPEESPYRDYQTGQNLTLSAGRLSVKRDPAGVAPKSSLLVAARYDVGIGGPASFYVRYSAAPSERSVLLPTNPRATREINVLKSTTHIADLGIDLALTGKKSWHHLVPSLLGGVGIASNYAAVDTGNYRFGTRFAFTYGAGLRYIAHSGFALRVDVTNYTWKYQYPDRYFVQASDSTAILSNTKDRSAYRGNWALMAGVAIPLFR